ncbi:MAG: OmpA family protein [Pseudomonadota bacterium]
MHAPEPAYPRFSSVLKTGLHASADSHHRESVAAVSPRQSLVTYAAAFLVLALLIAALPTQADTPLTFTLGGSYNIFDDERDVDDEFTPFGAAELRFNEYWATEFWYTEGETDSDLGFDADITRWHLDALYYLKPRGKFHPYVAAGVGQLDREWDVPNGSLDAVDEEINLGGGAHYFLSDRFSLRGDARYFHGTGSTTADFVLSLALSYRFGDPVGRKAAPVAVAAAAAPEEPCKDCDNDGVMNAQDECPNTPAGAKVNARGCKERFIAGESARLDVRFAFDKADVDASYLDDIEEFAAFMKRYPDEKAVVEAHTDSMGPEEYNQGLSQRRAEAVIDVLVDRYGVPSSSLTAKGFGETSPVADNSTAEGRAKNRRVMVNIATEDHMEEME